MVMSEMEVVTPELSRAAAWASPALKAGRIEPFAGPVLL